MDLKETNRRIRASLAEQFPGVRFSVRGDRYAGGAATSVAWIDGPDQTEVDPILHRYESSRFNMIDDTKDYVYEDATDEDGNPVRLSYGADHVFGRREYSPEVKQAAQEFVEAALRREGRKFDLNYPVPVPQAFYDRATEANHGVSVAGTYMWRHDDKSGYQLLELAARLEANERYVRQRESAS